MFVNVNIEKKIKFLLKSYKTKYQKNINQNINQAYIGCFEDWRYRDLFNYGITDSLIQSSEWTQNIWRPGQNWYAWTSPMTVAQCVNYCYKKGFLLAGLAQGLKTFFYIK